MSEHRLVVHLGLRHRGSQALRVALEKLRPELRSCGIAVVTDTDVSAAAAGVGWRAGSTDNTLAPFLEALASSVAREQAQIHPAASDVAGPMITFVSSTELLGPGVIGPLDHPLFRPNAGTLIAALAAALDASHTEVVLYTQRQDRLFDYAYLTGVMAGSSADLLDAFPYLEEPVLDYAGLADRLDALETVAGVIAKPLESVGDAAGLLEDLLTLLNVHDRVDLSGLGGLPNERTYSRLGMLVALAMNPHLETSLERDRVRTFVLDTFPPKDDTVNRVVDQTVRRALIELYLPSNEALFNRFGLAPLLSNYRNPPAPQLASAATTRKTPRTLWRRLRRSLRRRLRRR